MSFLPIFDRPNSIGEINSFLRRVVLQNGNSLLTGAESRVTLIPNKISAQRTYMELIILYLPLFILIYSFYSLPINTGFPVILLHFFLTDFFTHSEQRAILLLIKDFYESDRFFLKRKVVLPKEYGIFKE